MLSIFVSFYSFITNRFSPQIADETGYFCLAFIFVSLCSCFFCPYERHAAPCFARGTEGGEGGYWKGADQCWMISLIVISVHPLFSAEAL